MTLQLSTQPYTSTSTKNIGTSARVKRGHIQFTNPGCSLATQRSAIPDARWAAGANSGRATC
jgi:hypothetical protein